MRWKILMESFLLPDYVVVSFCFERHRTAENNFRVYFTLKLLPSPSHKFSDYFDDSLIGSQEFPEDLTAKTFCCFEKHQPSLFISVAVFDISDYQLSVLETTTTAVDRKFLSRCCFLFVAALRQKPCSLTVGKTLMILNDYG